MESEGPPLPRFPSSQLLAVHQRDPRFEYSRVDDFAALQGVRSQVHTQPRGKDEKRGDALVTSGAWSQ